MTQVKATKAWDHPISTMKRRYSRAGSSKTARSLSRKAEYVDLIHRQARGGEQIPAKTTHNVITKRAPRKQQAPQKAPSRDSDRHPGVIIRLPLLAGKGVLVRLVALPDKTMMELPTLNAMGNTNNNGSSGNGFATSTGNLPTSPSTPPDTSMKATATNTHITPTPTPSPKTTSITTPPPSTHAQTRTYRRRASPAVPSRPTRLGERRTAMVRS
ncbi:hypothetical protein SeMB42_g01708 [Synchytrium endobioticum]|uniref:Uncharacterized protein n=1 Tax=Synchytrium endobioticum TaxID=286115 RepID=A0A507DK28_9FUNG|nr:hypothetical protein SeLEV6574_g03888 [Synchytrium endobioticum]TPX52004.1 hypothetical protein SeMB42_g01708 [Synchytrium endobioticum]